MRAHTLPQKKATIRISPRLYARITLIALCALTAIVFTGAAVRLTGSGLGCPDWPRCYGEIAPPLETHAVIEFGNRVFSGFVGIACIAAALLAWLRRPFRLDLGLIGLLLPLGVVGQAVLGGFTVRSHLAPGFVMGHYGLSMLILIAAAALSWRARYEPGQRARTNDRLVVWLTRALLPLGALTVLVGTAATAAGPHAGGSGTGDVIHRLQLFGSGTLDFLIHQHGRIATILGIAAALAVFLARRRRADSVLVRSMTATAGLIALQGAIGIAQYRLHLPAEIVWVHVSLATVTWVTLLWSVGAAGRLSECVS